MENYGSFETRRETIVHNKSIYQQEEKSEEAIRQKDQDNKDQTKEDLPGFNLAEFEAQATGNDDISVTREITSIPVKKPNNQQWFKIHPKIQCKVKVFEWEEENKALYLVKTKALPYFEGLLSTVVLYLGMFPNGSVFLFPVRQRENSGNWNPWHVSQYEAVKKARKDWIRMQSDKPSQGYLTFKASGKLTDIPWPDLELEKIMEIAFRERIIANGDHPIVKHMLGKF
jgi:hypothetical protein